MTPRAKEGRHDQATAQRSCCRHQDEEDDRGRFAVIVGRRPQGCGVYTCVCTAPASVAEQMVKLGCVGGAVSRLLAVACRKCQCWWRSRWVPRSYWVQVDTLCTYTYIIPLAMSPPFLGYERCHDHVSDHWRWHEFVTSHGQRYRNLHDRLPNHRVWREQPWSRSQTKYYNWPKYEPKYGHCLKASLERENETQRWRPRLSTYNFVEIRDD